MADTSSTPAKEPSATDVAFMVLLFKHMKEKPVIDWDAFSAAGGFKNNKVAQTRYSQIKLKWGMSDTGGPKTPTKKKGGEGPGSASKVTKSGGRVGTKGRKGKAAVKAEEGDGDIDMAGAKSEQDDGEANIKPEDGDSNIKPEDGESNIKPEGDNN